MGSIVQYSFSLFNLAQSPSLLDCLTSLKPAGENQKPSSMVMDSPKSCWFFVGKVYAILTVQLLATIGVGATVRLVPSISHFLLETHAGIAVSAVIIVTPFIVLIPMLCLRHLKPANYFLVAIFTLSLAFQVGLTCVFAPGMVILESVFLTALSFITLTLFTFWAAWRGYNFSLLEPFLFEAITCLVISFLIQTFFPLGKISGLIYGALGTIVFCGYIVYDTYLLIERHSQDDDYILAAAELYLDVLNLFLSLSDLLRGDDDGCCSADCCE